MKYSESCGEREIYSTKCIYYKRKKDLKPFQHVSAHTLSDAGLPAVPLHFCASAHPEPFPGGREGRVTGAFPFQLICSYLITTNNPLNLRSSVPLLESIPQCPSLTEMLPSLSPIQSCASLYHSISHDVM